MNFNVCDDKASNSGGGWGGKEEKILEKIIKNAQNVSQFHAS
jgi:hypothetical protein